ncbi:hypothetical protein DEJ50_04605 [Streptomyces venezuelae]|uniref:Uncharacterized protein n=1 Tax=Streptomyces venezuelae TaxID=54571 RepID=A0A5P2CY66_STRVZ|nr:hypothetical protein DEJ50_04605 [Streptomyces venezuelae]
MAGAGIALVLGWLTAGYLLTLPMLMERLLAAQTPPQELSGPGEYAVVYGIAVAATLTVATVASKQRPLIWWLVAARAAGLYALVQVAARWADSRIEAAPEHWTPWAMAICGAAGLAALLFLRGVRAWDQKRGAGSRTPGLARRNGNRFGRPPLAGQIWVAMVPLREDPTQELRHYCVIVKPRLLHAEVLQITSKNKDGRRDFIRLPNDGWHKNKDKAHWVEFGQQPRKVKYTRFLANRPQGRCPTPAWQQLRSGRPAART